MLINRYVYQEEAGAEGGAGGASDNEGAKDEGTKEEINESTWPESWRQDMTGGDEKELKQAERYASPKDIWNKARALEQKIASGELVNKSEFPTDGSDEEKASWRTEQGLPSDVGGYDLSFENGLTIGEQDAPIVDGFKEIALNSNMSNEQVKGAVQWYYDTQEKQAEERQEKDQSDQQSFEDTYRTEWGTDYRQNINLIHAMLDGAPEGVKDKVLQGRQPDGMAFGNDPSVMEWLVSVARDLNPTGTLVPAGGGDRVQGIEDEISGIEEMMRTDRDKYNRDEKVQQRYRDLITARDKLKVG